MLVYYLHVDDEGNILGSKDGEEECFISRVGIWEYGIDEDNSDESFDDIYSNENLDCEAFADCVDDLTDQINRYIKENL